MNNILVEGDYLARVDLDPDGDIFHGRIIGITDVINFYGSSIDELKAAFKDAIADYQDWCAEDGQQPQRSLSGALTIYADPDLHQRIIARAVAEGRSVDSWILSILERETRQGATGSAD